MLEHFRMSDWNSEEVQGLRAAWSRMVDELNDRILMEAAENEESEIDITEGRDRKSTRLNSSHSGESRMPSSA